MNSRYTVSDLVLLSLEKSIQGYVRIEDFAYNTHIYAAGYDRQLKDNTLIQSIRRLRLKGYINLEYFQNKIILKLTDQGKTEAILRKVLKNDVWDGKYRVVIFDIPEEHKKLRNLFRSRLKIWHFQPLQKSVWVCKKDILPIMRNFIKEVGLSKWVIVFETDNLDP